MIPDGVKTLLVIVGFISAVVFSSVSPTLQAAGDSGDSCIEYDTEKVKKSCDRYEIVSKDVEVCDVSLPLIGCVTSHTEQEAVRTDNCLEPNYEEQRVCVDWANDNEEDVTPVSDDDSGSTGGDDGSDYYEPVEDENEPSCEPDEDYVCDGQKLSNGQITGYRWKAKKITDEDCSTEIVRVTSCVNQGNVPKVCSSGSCVTYQYQLTFQSIFQGIGIIPANTYNPLQQMQQTSGGSQ